MRLFRPVLLALIALLAFSPASAVAKKPKKKATPSLVPAAAVKNIKIGIADQKPGVFTDPLFQPLEIKYARRSVAWNAALVDWQIAELDAWLNGARAAGVTPLISFAKTRDPAQRRYLPSVAEYRAAFKAFRQRWPWVREFAPTNESNHPAEMGGTNPKRAVEYWRVMQSECRGCKVAAATLLDYESNSKKNPDKITLDWIRKFLKYAGKKNPPRLWAFHNYVSANKFSDRLSRKIMSMIKGEVWITEVGGLVYRKPAPGRVKLPESVTHQTKVTKYIFDHLIRTDKRFTRVYMYHWNSEGPGASWDSGLVDANGDARPALAILEQFLGKGAAGAPLPKATPGKPTPVGPADGRLPGPAKKPRR
jgi:hypothetical protein